MNGLPKFNDSLFTYGPVNLLMFMVYIFKLSVDDVLCSCMHLSLFLFLITI